MCGIVGFSGKNSLDTDKILYLMYQNSIERGRHSTGFYSPETGVKKDAKTPEEFLIDNPIPNSNVFIGHVRHATVGAKSKANSHPFEFDNIVGVHNGTLENHWGMLAKRSVSNKNIDVDSQALYKLLDEDSKQDKIVYSTLSEFDGAAALLFQDKRNTKLLYAYRNADRPLFCGYIGKDMYISSITSSLKLIGCDDISVFESNFLYKISDGKIISKQWYKEFVKPPVIYNNKHYKKKENIDFTKLLSGHQQQQWDCEDQGCSVVGINSKKGVNDREYVKNIDKLSSFNNGELISRWLMVLNDKLIKYGESEVNVTKGEWYFISDYNLNNNYDVKIQSDDKDNEVWVPKFIFDAGYIKIDTWVVTTNPIVDKNDNSIKLFEEGEVLEVIDDKEMIDKMRYIQVYDEKKDQSRNIPIVTLRCATDREVIDHLAKVEDIKATNDTNTPFVSPIDKVINEAANSAKNFFDDIDGPISQSVDGPVQQVNEQEEKYSDVEELLPISFYECALDVITDKVLEIKDLVETTNFKELQEGIDELEELVEELYDTDKLEAYVQNREEVKEQDSIITKC